MIQPITPAVSEITLSRTSQAQNTANGSFAGILQDALDTVSQTAADASKQSLGLLTGETENIHSVVLATEKADLALRLTLQVRNKALDAYNEIMRMQL